MTDIILCVIILALVAALVYLDRLHGIERRDMLDRIQAGTIRDYQAFKSVEPERKKVVNVEIPTIVQPEEPPAPPMMPIGEVHAAGGRLMGG